MTRVKGGTVARARRKKILKQAKGFFGSKHRLWKTAQEQLMHSGMYAYRDRKQNKRNFRKLWITRINAACRENEISYSKFINGLSKAGLLINRKMLSELAIDNAVAFTDLVEISKSALDGKTYQPKVAKKAEVEKKETVKKSTVKKDEVEEIEEVKTAVVKKVPVVKKTAVKKPVIKKETVKKTVIKKPTVKKETVKKPTVKKETVKKTTVKKAAK
jgi:large subunit ribosomal protein L20